MQTHDILSRVSAILSMMAALWNGLVATLYIAMLIWFLVGFLWFVPMFLVVLEGLAALAILIIGFRKPNPVVPLVGMFVSLCCFNVLAGMLELLSLGLQISAFIAYNSAQKAGSDMVFAADADAQTEEAPRAVVPAVPAEKTTLPAPVYLHFDDVELMPLPA